MKITQAYVSPGLSFFEYAFREKYGLEPYTNPVKPAVFFGNYGAPDRQALQNHRATAIMVWGGTDAMRIHPSDPLMHKKSIKHIAIGAFIEKDLAAAGLKYHSVPITPFKGQANPAPKGAAIYAYVPQGRETFYGQYLIEAMNLPYEVIIGGSERFTRSQMTGIYSKCFIGLRLTPHDGLPNTVVELALMGIPCVYNGTLPGSLPWHNLQDIRSHISQQSRFIGQTDHELANQMHLFINHNSHHWLYTGFYE